MLCCRRNSRFSSLPLASISASVNDWLALTTITEVTAFTQRIQTVQPPNAPCTTTTTRPDSLNAWMLVRSKSSPRHPWKGSPLCLSTSPFRRSRHVTLLRIGWGLLDHIKTIQGGNAQGKGLRSETGGGAGCQTCSTNPGKWFRMASAHRTLCVKDATPLDTLEIHGTFYGT